MGKVIEDPAVATIALASLTKMVSLLAAELVVGSHHDDIDRLEAAVRAKLYAAVEGISPEATAAGVALAHQLIEPVLKDLRARVEAKAQAAGENPPPPQPKVKVSAAARKLN